MSLAVEEPNGNVLAYRVKKVEENQVDVERWRRHVDEERVAMREQMKTNTVAVQGMASGMETLKRTLIGFAITIAASSVGFALAVLASSGRL